jgi:Mycothiol maleylpyruvate isomerase N-terminal domain
VAVDPGAPTLCQGWTARHLCAHLVQRQDAILRNLWDQAKTRVPGRERFMSRVVERAGVRSFTDWAIEG